MQGRKSIVVEIVIPNHTNLASPFVVKVQANKNHGICDIVVGSKVPQEVSKGQFMFTSKDPIFVGELAKIQRKYQELSRRYRNNGVQKQDTPKPEEKEETGHEFPENDPLALTQFAIDLLKEQGYLIFAPTCIEYTQM